METVENIANRINQNDISGIRDGLKHDSAFLNVSAMIHAADLTKCPADIVEMIRALRDSKTEVLNYIVGEVAEAALDIMGVELYAGKNKSIIRMIDSRF